MNIAYGSSVSSSKRSFIDYSGIKQYEEESTKHPITAEAKGILNFRRYIGNLVCVIFPFVSMH